MGPVPQATGTMLAPHATHCATHCAIMAVRHGHKKRYTMTINWRLLKGEVQFSGMPLPVPLPTIRPCAQLGSMACVMATSADATFSGTVLLCPFSLEQPHDIADGMYVQVSAAPLTDCLAVTMPRCLSVLCVSV
jgi:hypothetical protein